MTPFPFSFGPSDDWDPQGYGADEEELEDELMTAGMSIKSDDDDDDDVTTDDEEEDEEDAVDEDEDEDGSVVDPFNDEAIDPLAELDSLADQVNKTERETLRFKADFDE